MSIVPKKARGTAHVVGNWLAARLLHHLYGLRLTDLVQFRAIRTAVLHERAREQMTDG
jgi:hypothetical protein